MSQHTEFRLIRGQNRLQLVKESFQYVPILETLKALLNQPDVLAEVYQLCFSCTVHMVLKRFSLLLNYLTY
jgi:hypothetical protein